jgi:signal transduction histidine kinase/CheY-like chemotaxis protein
MSHFSTPQVTRLLLNDQEQSVLVLAPTGRDGDITCAILNESGVLCRACQYGEALLSELDRGAGVLFIAEEALSSGLLRGLNERLKAQPAWSDIPIIISTLEHTEFDSDINALRTLETFRNVTFLARPLRIMTLVSLIRNALSARSRQYYMRDILEREHAARLEAENTNRLKDEFLATLSHELRTPLNIIIGFTELLTSEIPGSQEFYDALAAISRSAKVQAELVNDLLDVSKIVTGKMVIEVKPVDLVRIIKETADSFSLPARAKRIQVKLNVDCASSTTLGDEVRLQQVVWNLLSNAFKFTQTGGCVELSLRHNADHLIFEIKDNGEGIDPSFLPFVFDRFRQQDGSTTRKHGGLGLGLSISKHIVDMHGGRISVSSEGIGYGTIFQVLLPIFADLQKTGYPGAGFVRREQYFDQYSTLGDKMLNKIKVLIVDDNGDNRRLIKAFLHRVGIEATEAESAQKARMELQRNHFDLLLCDIGMPEEDGLTFLKNLRASADPYGRIPAAALTGYSRDEDRQMALKAGFNAHLSKPIQPNKLIEVAKSLLELRN